MRRRNNANPHHSNGANRGGHNRPRRYNNNRPGGYSSSPGQDDNVNVARVRRHAMTQREKYNNMARDALSSGDRVQAEYYFQHVEHYTRVLGELPPEENRQPRPHNPGQFRDPNAQQTEGNEGQAQEPQRENTDFSQEDEAPPAASALPSFITGSVRPRGSVPAPAQPLSDEE